MMRLFAVLATISVAAALPGARNNQWDPECGTSAAGDEAGSERPTTNIVGGWDAIRGEWPWQVSMRSGEAGVTAYCGASIMNNDWVITAAHCCEGELAANIYLIVGEYDMDESDAANPERGTHRVSDRIMHEDYGPVTLVNDICLLKLINPITYSTNVGAVCSPQAEVDYTGVYASTSGWGNTRPNTMPARILQTVNQPTVSNEICYEEMAKYEPTWFITEDMMCAGQPGDETRDTCQGDSGGPLHVKNVEGLWELIGLTSWGYNCASGVPGVFCRVTHFLDWIDLKMATTP